MGAVLGPKDVLKGRKHMLREVAKDLGADQVLRIEELLSRWGDESRKELIQILGKERAKKLLSHLGII